MQAKPFHDVAPLKFGHVLNAGISYTFSLVIRLRNGRDAMVWLAYAMIDYSIIPNLACASCTNRRLPSITVMEILCFTR